jgi:hypothetical protein
VLANRRLHCGFTAILLRYKCNRDAACRTHKPYMYCCFAPAASCIIVLRVITRACVTLTFQLLHLHHCCAHVLRLGWCEMLLLGPAAVAVPSAAAVPSAELGRCQLLLEGCYTNKPLLAPAEGLQPGICVVG